VLEQFDDSAKRNLIWFDDRWTIDERYDHLRSGGLGMGNKVALTSSLLRVLDQYIISSLLPHRDNPGMMKRLLT